MKQASCSLFLSLPISCLFICKNQWNTSKHCHSENFLSSMCVVGRKWRRSQRMSNVIGHFVLWPQSTQFRKNCFLLLLFCIQLWQSSVPVNSDLCCSEAVLQPLKSVWELVFIRRKLCIYWSYIKRISGILLKKYLDLLKKNVLLLKRKITVSLFHFQLRNVTFDGICQ